MDQSSTDGDGRSFVGPRTFHCFFQKVYFGRDRHDEGFRPYQSHRTEFPLVSYFGRSYPVEASGGYSISV